MNFISYLKNCQTQYVKIKLFLDIMFNALQEVARVDDAKKTIEIQTLSHDKVGSTVSSSMWN